MFLDVSKACNKVWHKGFLFKLKSYDVDGELLSLLECWSSNREQRVVLNGQTSDWRKINFGVPQWTVLDHLLFLIYITAHLTELLLYVKSLLMILDFL